MLCPGTCTDDPSILVVSTVMDAPSEAVAGGQEGLAAITVDVIQQDEPRAVAEIGVALVIQGLATSQLPADHAGIAQAPVIVTHSAPAPAVEDLHAALAGVGPAHQADAAITCRVGNRVRRTFPSPGGHHTAMPPSLHPTLPVVAKRPGEKQGKGGMLWSSTTDGYI